MDHKSESKVCMETIKAALDKSNWSYDVPEEFFIVTGANGINAPIRLFIGIDTDKPTMYIHSPLPLEVAEDKIDVMARAVCEVNFTMLVGSFDFDIAKRRLVFKSTLPFLESLVSEAVCSYMVVLACLMVDKYYIEFMQLNDGKLTLDEFVQEIHKD